MRLLLPILLLLAGPAAAQFHGRLTLAPPGCDAVRRCTIVRDFAFVDRHDVGWMVRAGDVTNGADIPAFAQRFVGFPFERAFLPAVVLHDHYSRSVRPVYGWLQTQRMFREALLANGVDLARANVMYAAVLIGSGKWIVPPVRGIPCRYGAICLRVDDAPVVRRQADIDGTGAYRTALTEARAAIEARAEMTEAEVEALAATLRPERPWQAREMRLIERPYRRPADR